MGWFEGGLSFLGGVMTNKANAKQADYNRNFQMEMSNTAHQREVADLRAAGLNPILSATGGSGASQPSGSVAIMQDPISPAIKAKNESSQTDAQIIALFAQAASANAQAELIKAQTVSEGKRPALLEADTQLSNSAKNLNVKTTAGRDIENSIKTYENAILRELVGTKIDTAKIERLIKNRQYEILGADLQRAKIEGQIDKTKFGETMRYVDRILKSIGVATDSINIFKPRLNRVR